MAVMSWPQSLDWTDVRGCLRHDASSKSHCIYVSGGVKDHLDCLFCHLRENPVLFSGGGGNATWGSTRVLRNARQPLPEKRLAVGSEKGMTIWCKQHVQRESKLPWSQLQDPELATSSGKKLAGAGALSYLEEWLHRFKRNSDEISLVQKCVCILFAAVALATPLASEAAGECERGPRARASPKVMSQRQR